MPRYRNREKREEQNREKTRANNGRKQTNNTDRNGWDGHLDGGKEKRLVDIQPNHLPTPPPRDLRY